MRIGDRQTANEDILQAVAIGGRDFFLFSTLFNFINLVIRNLLFFFNLAKVK